jgi:hypothetical protein
VRLARRTPARAAGAFVAVTIAAGCGGIKAPDLFIVERDGTTAGSKLTLLVNDEGGVHCNGRATFKLGDPQLVEARAIQEALHDSASRHLSLPPGPQSVLSYHLRDENGAVRFSDNSAGQPAVLRQLALFVLRVAQQVCHLPE